jgi:hypothetical protein
MHLTTQLHNPHHASRTTHASRITHHASRITYHASRITHHVSRITSHVSRITSHVSHLTFYLTFSLLLVLGASACTADASSPTDAPTPKTSSVTPERSTAPSPTSQPATVQSPLGNGGSAPAVMTSPDYGMQVFLFWREEVADRDLNLVQEAGFRWVKQEFAWREIEGAGPGVFDWGKTDRVMDQIDSHGLKVIARVGVQPEWAGGDYPQVGPPDDYQDFANFLNALAKTSSAPDWPRPPARTR